MNPQICRSFSENPVFFNFGEKTRFLSKKPGFWKRPSNWILSYRVTPYILIIACIVYPFHFLVRFIPLCRQAVPERLSRRVGDHGMDRILSTLKFMVHLNLLRTWPAFKPSINRNFWSTMIHNINVLNCTNWSTIAIWHIIIKHVTPKFKLQPPYSHIGLRRCFGTLKLQHLARFSLQNCTVGSLGPLAKAMVKAEECWRRRGFSRARSW